MFGSLWTYVGAMVVTMALAAVKKTDAALVVAPLYRKLQPLLAVGVTYGVPWVAQHLGVTVDPAVFTTAPLATLVAIVGAEITALVTKGPDA